MKIIISPAKKMREDVDSLSVQNMPIFLSKTQKLLNYLNTLPFSELQKLWACNETIAKQNLERLQNMDLKSNLTPAIIAYDGIAFQYMAPSVFEDKHFEYIQRHLRILSGFYGILKPMDGVRPYRLEMQAKTCVEEYRDLYEFWGNDIYMQIRDSDGIIINLASKEYSKCIEKYLTLQDTFITCVFGEIINGKLVQKGTFAKMARGEMVRYLAEHQIEDPEEIKKFNRLGFIFRSDLSSKTKYVFERIPK